LNDYGGDGQKLNLDAQLEAIVPQEIYEKGHRKKSHRGQGRTQLFYSALRADAIASSIAKFSAASRRHLPEDCQQMAASACERSTSLCQDITNRISPSSSDDASTTSRKSARTRGRPAGQLHPANPGLLLFVAAMCCVVLYGNLSNAGGNPLSRSDARYERLLRHRSLAIQQQPQASGNSPVTPPHGGPTDINALLESQYRAQAEMSHSASVLAASNAAALPITSDQPKQQQPAQHHPSRHQPSHHSAHHPSQYAQQPQQQAPVLISEPTYYPDTDESSGAAGTRGWTGAGIWLFLAAGVVGGLASLFA